MINDATVLHADADSFYASVEQRDNPGLLGRPVIVGGGVVLAASYEAKAFGVRTAMSGRRARSLCPQAIVVQPRMSVYTEASKALYAVFEDFSPLVEALSIDEAFLDVRGMERIAGTPLEIATRLRESTRARVGLPVTVGVARTKFLAKVASAVAKPDGLLLVPPEGELEFLHPLPVERVWGVGATTAGRLRRPRDRERRRSRASTVGGARGDARPGRGAAPARARKQQRPASGAEAPAPSLDRGAERRFRFPPEPGSDGSHTDLTRRTRDAAPPGGQARNTNRRSSPAFRRFLAGD